MKLSDPFMLFWLLACYFSFLRKSSIPDGVNVLSVFYVLLLLSVLLAGVVISFTPYFGLFCLMSSYFIMEYAVIMAHLVLTVSKRNLSKINNLLVFIGAALLVLNMFVSHNLIILFEFLIAHLGLCSFCVTSEKSDCIKLAFQKFFEKAGLETFKLYKESPHWETFCCNPSQNRVGHSGRDFLLFLDKTKLEAASYSPLNPTTEIIDRLVFKDGWEFTKTDMGLRCCKDGHYYDYSLEGGKAYEIISVLNKVKSCNYKVISNARILLRCPVAHYVEVDELVKRLTEGKVLYKVEMVQGVYLLGEEDNSIAHEYYKKLFGPHLYKALEDHMVDVLGYLDMEVLMSLISGWSGKKKPAEAKNKKYKLYCSDMNHLFSKWLKKENAIKFCTMFNPTKAVQNLMEEYETFKFPNYKVNKAKPEPKKERYSTENMKNSKDSLNTALDAEPFEPEKLVVYNNEDENYKNLLALVSKEDEEKPKKPEPIDFLKYDFFHWLKNETGVDYTHLKKHAFAVKGTTKTAYKAILKNEKHLDLNRLIDDYNRYYKNTVLVLMEEQDKVEKEMKSAKKPKEEKEKNLEIISAACKCVRKNVVGIKKIEVETKSNYLEIKAKIKEIFMKISRLKTKKLRKYKYKRLKLKEMKEILNYENLSRSVKKMFTDNTDFTNRDKNKLIAAFKERDRIKEWKLVLLLITTVCKERGKTDLLHGIYTTMKTTEDISVYSCLV